jgi:hypothetical protein
MQIASLLLVLIVNAAQQPSATAAGGPPMTPGKWQITFHTLTPVDLPPMVSVICVDAGYASQIGSPKSHKNDDCQVITPAFDGVDLSYGIRCAKSGVTSQIKVKFQGNSYSGDITVNTGTSVTTQHIEGVRLGVCDAQ